MNREQVMRILATHREDLKRFHVKRLALFGSVARDEARADSDVDLLGVAHRAAGRRMHAACRCCPMLPGFGSSWHD
jgi:predicted nucleotidyltransferase